MVCLELEPGASGWKALTDPLNYGRTPSPLILNFLPFLINSIQAVGRDLLTTTVSTMP